MGQRILKIVRLRTMHISHSHLISNEPIKLGDYFYRLGCNELYRGSGFTKDDYKVIASTEKLNDVEHIENVMVLNV